MIAVARQAYRDLQLLHRARSRAGIHESPTHPSAPHMKSDSLAACLSCDILECSDRSLYVGSTWDLDRRLSQHNEGVARGVHPEQTPGAAPLLGVLQPDRERVPAREAGAAVGQGKTPCAGEGAARSARPAQHEPTTAADLILVDDQRTVARTTRVGSARRSSPTTSTRTLLSRTCGALLRALRSRSRRSRPSGGSARRHRARAVRSGAPKSAARSPHAPSRHRAAGPRASPRRARGRPRRCRGPALATCSASHATRRSIGSISTHSTSGRAIASTRPGQAGARAHVADAPGEQRCGDGAVQNVTRPQARRLEGTDESALFAVLRERLRELPREIDACRRRSARRPARVRALTFGHRCFT